MGPLKVPSNGSFKGAICSYLGSSLGFDVVQEVSLKGPRYGPLASLQASEVWTPFLEVACGGVLRCYNKFS